MERKPQRQTLSIRISDSLRDSLERSKEVISFGRDDSLSISDVAKILLESAMQDLLDHRLEAAELNQSPTESLVAIRKKWQTQRPLSRAEWTFLAWYVRVGCDQLTADPLAPAAESYAVLSEAFLAVRDLRANRGLELDRFYFSNLPRYVPPPGWKMDSESIPTVVAGTIEAARKRHDKNPAIGVGRNLFVALRDEAISEVAALNDVLTPYMNTLFRMAARGHWIKEREPVRLAGEGVMSLREVPVVRDGDLSFEFEPGAHDIDATLGIEPANLTYKIRSYPQIREFVAMVKSLAPPDAWRGVSFQGAAIKHPATKMVTYKFHRPEDGVELRFTEENWLRLKGLCLKAMEQPELVSNFAELSLIYGEQ